MTHGQTVTPVLMTIADFVVALHTDDAAVAERLRRQYQLFLGAQREPDLAIQLQIVPGALFIQPESGPWIINSTIDDERITYGSYVSRGDLELATGAGTLEMAPDASVENYLRVLFAWLCLEHGGLLLHAAGVVRQGQGYVFFGPSGAGKTTTSRLAAQTATVLSDDLVIIRPVNGRYRLYGVPFRGDLSDAPRANQQAPLRGIFRLRQDRSHFVRPLSRVTAVAELTAAAPFVVDKPALSGQLLDVCTAIARQVPVQELHFVRDDGYWKVIDEYLDDIPATASANGR